MSKQKKISHERRQATQYVNQKMMPHLINQQSMAEKPLFTSLDLKAAYEEGYREGYSEGRQESLLDQLKRNKDEEAELYAKRKQEEAWHEIINNKFQNIM